MKTNRSFLRHSTLAVLITGLLSASSLQAQTVVGQPKLTHDPAQLEAAVYPLTSQYATIKVIFNNRTGGAVRVVIRDQKGTVCYDQYERLSLYRRCFDLSGLPTGNYTVELSKRNEQFVQAFAINPPAVSHVAMVSKPKPQDADLVADQNLVKNQ